MPSHWASTFRAVVAYLPICLYAESLRLNSAIILAIASRSALPLPTTGCIRDLGMIWHLSPSDVLSDFDQGDRPVVASLRHGNSFSFSKHSSPASRIHNCAARDPHGIGRSSLRASPDLYYRNQSLPRQSRETPLY
jgi:hypothetical protein